MHGDGDGEATELGCISSLDLKLVMIWRGGAGAEVWLAQRLIGRLKTAYKAVSDEFKLDCNECESPISVFESSHHGDHASMEGP